MPAVGAERVQKVIARSGLTSRRGAEQMIRDGRVCVDGRPVQLGDRITAGQALLIDNKPVRWQASPVGGDNEGGDRVFLYHKPEHELCTRDDPRGRRTVFDGLSEGGVDTTGRLVLVGRLDFNTSGLLLLTNSGDLANQLAHPSYGLQREYLCRVHGTVTPSTIKKLLSGIVIDGKSARFLCVERTGGTGGTNQWFTVVLGEGRYREVRRLWQAVGCTVTRLKRVRFGPLQLPRNLRPGQWRELSASQVNHLRQTAHRAAHFSANRSSNP